MNKKLIGSFVMLFIMITISSCNKEKKFARRIDGTWNVDKLEWTDNGTGYSVSNAGSIDFKKDGTGKNNLSYTVGTVDVNDKESFKWTYDKDVKTVTIEGNANGGQKQTVYYIDDNSKDTQVWNTSLQNNETIKLTLTKQ